MQYVIHCMSSFATAGFNLRQMVRSALRHAKPERTVSKMCVQIRLHLFIPTSRIVYFLIYIRGPLAKFVDSPYYSESELCRGAVTVCFSKYLPWQPMHFLQRSTHFSKTCCRPLITSKFLSLGLPFHGWKSPESHEARSELNSVFCLEKMDRWNPIRTSAIQSRPITISISITIQISLKQLRSYKIRK
jgi:hypothetical protein